MLTRSASNPLHGSVHRPIDVTRIPGPSCRGPTMNQIVCARSRAVDDYLEGAFRPTCDPLSKGTLRDVHAVSPSSRLTAKSHASCARQPQRGCLRRWS